MWSRFRPLYLLWWRKFFSPVSRGGLLFLAPLVYICGAESTGLRKILGCRSRRSIPCRTQRRSRSEALLSEAEARPLMRLPDLTNCVRSSLSYYPSRNLCQV
jgi:hypothetical protein